MKARFGISVLFAVLLSSFHAFYSIPRCEAAVAPVRMVWLVVAIAGPQTSAAAIMPGRLAQIAVIAMPQSCEAGVMEQLCSSVTNFLNEESAKADADAKACKKNCNWKKRKDELIDGARKKAKESCSKGEAPDVNNLSKGLDRNTKDKLKDLYNRNSRMFDGTAKLEAANFSAVSSKDAAITGKGGQVTDLKSAEPATPKLTVASEFSLTKTSNILASTKTVLLSKAQAAGDGLPICPRNGAVFCPGNLPCPGKQKCVSDIPFPEEGWLNDCMANVCGQTDDGGDGGGGTGKPSLWTRIKNLWHGLWGEKPCGGGYYKTKTQCCAKNNTIIDKCGKECYDPDTEYCENQKKCDKDCSAGTISASPLPTNGEVVLAIGETATLTVSGDKGDALGWWTSGGTLTASADNKRATITSMNSGKITVTFGSKTCSKCRTSIVVAFVKVVKIVSDRTLISEGGTIKFEVTTEPDGAVYRRLALARELMPVAVTAIPPDPGSALPPRDTIKLTNKPLEAGFYIYQFNHYGGLYMRATAGDSDQGALSKQLIILIK